MLLWIDGFDSYGDTIDSDVAPVGILAQKYTGGDPAASSTVRGGRFSGHSLQVQGEKTITTPLLTTDSTLIVGFAYNYNWIYDTRRILAFYDGATLGMNLCMSLDHELCVFLGNTEIARTSGLGLTAGTWYYIEFKVVCNASGSYEVHVNGDLELSATGVNTKAGSNNYHTHFGFTRANDYMYYLDDVYALDGSGSVNNTFLGNQRVETIRPDADDTISWTPDSGGTNYSRVNESECNTSSYVSDTGTGNSDLYGYADLAILTAGIHGAQITTIAEAADASDLTIQLQCKSGSNFSNSANCTLSAGSYLAFRHLLEQDPNTATAWTASGLNAAKFGFTD